MNSILSFPDRGPWGDSKYRGNCSGHVYKALFEQLAPRSFCDPMVGSGTSIAVAQEMGIEAHGLDLRYGFNALRDSILEAIGGNAVDLTVSHPPYGEMTKSQASGAIHRIRMIFPGAKTMKTSMRSCSACYSTNERPPAQVGTTARSLGTYANRGVM